MALKQEFESFTQRQFFGAMGFPSPSDGVMSFGVMFVESFSSIARSSVESGRAVPPLGVKDQRRDAAATFSQLAGSSFILDRFAAAPLSSATVAWQLYIFYG